MVRMHAPVRTRPDQRQQVSIGHPASVALMRKPRISPFWQHFLEMFAAMWVGMVAGVPVFLVISGQSAPREAALLYPMQALLGMAFSMTLPMVGWMLFRGHGWRNSAEMAGAMLLPAIPFVILAGLHIVKGTTCCAYMALSTLAMLGLMFYRQDEYSMPMRSLWRRYPQP